MHATPTPTLAQAAQLYAGAGWPVLPLHQADADTVCSCKLGPDCRQPGKHPRTPGGHHAATTNPDQVRAWWARWPQANIGIATGTSGLAVVDLDGPQGLATWQALTDQRGPEPATAAAATPHGEHRWYRLPEGLTVPRRIRALGDGIDVLGDGGYAIAPPSAIPCTRQDAHTPCNGGYTWHCPQHRLAPLPGWIIRALEQQREAEQATPDQVRQAMRRARPRASRSARYGQVALAGEAARVANASAGERNGTLNTAAYRLGRLIAAGHLTEHEAMRALLDAARTCGHIDDDGEYTARRTITSGLTAGQRHGSHSRTFAVGR